MVFSSLVFLFAFFPITLFLYYLSPRKLRNLVLFLASLAFYAWGEPVYILLMLFSTVSDYFHGMFIEKYRHKKRVAKLLLASAMVINLSMLLYFKYVDFFLININHAFGWNFPLMHLALPIGISFYTFQTMSYSIDIYRGDAKVAKNIIDFGAYVAMFPQLIAGPIVRYQDVADQLAHRQENWRQFTQGVRRFIVGLGKKVILANNIGALWSRILGSDMSQLSVLGAWMGLIAFGLQIYLDFSAYSDMAIGLAKMFGIEFLENFNYPYISQSITEFWRRWHISLGIWFRDYVYIPLGGNRKGRGRMYLNIFIVWFLTGFWHGSSWNFILWGLYFCIILMLEKTFLLKALKKVPPIFRHIYVLFLVLISWGLFAFEDFTALGAYFRVMFGAAPLLNNVDIYLLLGNALLFIACFIASTPLMSGWARRLTFSWVLEPLFALTVLVVSTAYLVDSSYNPFLYFRF